VVNFPRNALVSFARNGWSACAGMWWSRSSESPGMRVKYAILIKLLLEGDSRGKIYNETSTSIILGLVVMGGYSRFEIQQAFGVIVVKWISESNIFGVFKLEWKLDENMYQEKMYEIICNDIAKINQQLP